MTDATDATSQVDAHTPPRRALIVGGGTGLGLASSLALARRGWRVFLTGRRAERLQQAQALHPVGRCLWEAGDGTDPADVQRVVASCVKAFGGIDMCVNNASAINLSGTEYLPMKSYDLMQDINTRGTFMLSRACIPHLERSPNAHILTLSPPINLVPRWAGGQLGYTIAKYGMTLCALGLAEELREAGIASNALWPRTLVATAAVRNLLGGEAVALGLGCAGRRDRDARRAHDESIVCSGHADR